MVQLVTKMGEDVDVARSAWVSTEGERSEEEHEPGRVKGLIGFLMKNRHGSPFEQCVMRFRVTAPIFVWREHMRHRIASYNEQSGRYMKLDPVFYVPALGERPIVQEGKPGAYTFVAGDDIQTNYLKESIERCCMTAYFEYEGMLRLGIAPEVARMVLPVNIYSTAYVSMNLRALMNFLSLRTKSELARDPSFPMYEIELVGSYYEALFEEHFPLVHEAWNSNGRVAP